jgi:hypothetical protein
MIPSVALERSLLKVTFHPLAAEESVFEPLQGMLIKPATMTDWVATMLWRTMLVV